MATQVPVAENLDAAMHILHATALNKDFQDDIHKFYDGWAKDYDKVLKFGILGLIIVNDNVFVHYLR